MAPVGNTIPMVKSIIAASIQRNTHHGYIGCGSCNNICVDIYDCLNICEASLAIYEYRSALEGAIFILISSVDLATYADSSSGMLTDVIMRAYELIDKCTKEIEKQDQQMRDRALTLILEEAKKSVFDGWTDWRYDLLKCGICLCDETSAKEMENAMDDLLDIAKESYFPEYAEKEDIIVRYLLHRHLYGKKAAKKELYQNISVNELRIIAIKDAMEEKNYVEAERLCLEKVNEESIGYYRSADPDDWNNMLYNVYKLANNTDKEIAQAKKLLLMGNDKFWDVLKKLYNKCGTWNENYENLLNELKESDVVDCYRSILITENEKKRLLEDVTENPYDLFYYGKYLVRDYPEKLYELCYEEISASCTQAKNRREYKKITKKIAQLIRWKGTDTAKLLIEELKQKYPRKSALLDELEKVEKKL